jgi:hypothetical protein
MICLLTLLESKFDLTLPPELIQKIVSIHDERQVRALFNTATKSPSLGYRRGQMGLAY